MRYVTRLLGENEQVLITARRHWLTMLRGAAKGILGAVVVIAAIWATSFYLPYWRPYPTLALVAVLLWPLAAVLAAYLRWNHELYVVTNFRVIQVDGVFNKSVLDSSLEKVNDVVMRQSLSGRLLDYGDIEILTASENAINRFPQIAHPIKFKRTMLAAKNEREGIWPGRRGDDDALGERAAPEQGDASVLSGLNLLKERGLLSEEEYRRKMRQIHHE